MTAMKMRRRKAVGHGGGGGGGRRQLDEEGSWVRQPLKQSASHHGRVCRRVDCSLCGSPSSVGQGIEGSGDINRAKVLKEESWGETSLPTVLKGDIGEPVRAKER
jgi:hypothetical protein